MAVKWFLVVRAVSRATASFLPALSLSASFHHHPHHIDLHHHCYHYCRYCQQEQDSRYTQEEMPIKFPWLWLENKWNHVLCLLSPKCMVWHNSASEKASAGIEAALKIWTGKWSLWSLARLQNASRLRSNSPAIQNAHPSPRMLSLERFFGFWQCCIIGNKYNIKCFRDSTGALTTGPGLDEVKQYLQSSASFLLLNLNPLVSGDLSTGALGGSGSCKLAPVDPHPSCHWRSWRIWHRLLPS